MNVFLYDPSQRFFRQRGHRLFLKCFLYKRWLLNATSRREVSHCRPIMSEVCYCVCMCCVLFTILLSRFNRISAVNTDCDIYLHTGENLYKRKKKIFSTSAVFPLVSPSGADFMFLFYSPPSDVTRWLLAFWLQLHGCVSVCVCVCVCECERVSV